MISRDDVVIGFLALVWVLMVGWGIVEVWNLFH